MKRRNHSKMCKIADCDEKATRREMCDRHYRRFMKHGDAAISERKTSRFREVPKWLLKSFDTETDACVDFPFSIKQNGYGQIWFNGKKDYPHRIACAHRNGPPPNVKFVAAHSCNNRKCVNPKHLSWKDQAGNMADKITHGTLVFGTRCHNAKLNNAAVKFIRAFGGKVSDAVLSSTFGVTKSAIADARKFKTWKHVND